MNIKMVKLRLDNRMIFMQFLLVIYFVFVGCMFCGEIVNAADLTMGDYTYSTYDSMGTGWMITSYTGNDMVVDIPDNINGSPVLAIGAEAFKDCDQMVDIYVPSSVVEIADGAFSGCSDLQRVIWLTDIFGLEYVVADNIFEGCSEARIILREQSTLFSYIQKTVIPYELDINTSLIGYAYSRLDDGTISFEGFYNVDETNCKQLVIPDTIGGLEVTEIKDVYFHSYDMDMNELEISLIIPNTVTRIDENAMSWGYYDELNISKANDYFIVDNNTLYDITKEKLVALGKYTKKSYTVRDGVKYIYEGALSACGSETIILPASIDDLSNGALHNCYLLSAVLIDEDNANYKSINGVVYSKDGKEIVAYPAAMTNALYTIASGTEIIGEKAFYNGKNLTSISIPDTVTTIEEEAFYNSKITTIVIPDSVTSIGKSAFERSALKSVTLSNNISCIDDSVFENCSYLKEMVVPQGVKSIGKRAFYYCNQMKTITLPDTLEIIDEDAFAYCRILNGIVLPESLHTINKYAFYYCEGLTEIELPNSISTFGSNIFSYCTKLTNVSLPSSLKIIPSYIFSNCTKLCNIVLPKSIEEIGSNAFSGCNSLSEIVFPEGLQKIGSSAFGKCIGLTIIEFPDSLVSIGDSAFSGCTAVTDIIFPVDLSSIGSNAFSGCIGLSSITMPANLKTTGRAIFSGCTNLKTVGFMTGITEIKDYMFYGCNGISIIAIPNTVTKIGEYAFANISTLGVVLIPDSVTSIGNNNFIYCSSDIVVFVEEGSAAETYVKNKKINYSYMDETDNSDYEYTLLDDGTYCITKYNGTSTVANVPMQINGILVTEIGNKAFYENKIVEEIVLPLSVVAIGDDAFTKCVNLSKCTFTNNVSKIGARALKGCTSLTSLSLPTSLSVISEEMIQGCTNLTKVIIGSKVTIIEKLAFSECKSLINVSMPGALKTIGEEAFSKCTSLENLVVGTGVTTIGISAFNGCSKLKSVELPTSNFFSTIPDYAFKDCVTLEQVTLHNSIHEISENAFEGCVNLKEFITENCFHYKAIEGILCDSSGTRIVIWPMGLFNGTSETDNPEEKAIVIPEGITTISETIFQNNSQITSVTIPSTVTYINFNAFKGCTNLTEYIVAEGNTKYASSDGSILSVDKSSLISCPTGIKDQYVLPESVASFNRTSFMNCTQLTEIVLHDGVTQIPEYAFANCTALTKVVFPQSVKILSSYIFSGCIGLKEVEIPEWITTINSYAFQNCTNLEKVVIPESVTTINPYAFSNCTNLSEVQLSDSIKTINSYAFNGCSTLQKIAIPTNVTIINAGVFKDCTKLNEVVLHSGITKIQTSAFEGCNNLTSVTLPEGVTTIGARAYANCKNLKEMYIPISVGNIDDTAFENCNSDFVLIVEKNSYAESFAKQNGVIYQYPYVAVTSVTLNNNTLAMKTGEMQVLKATVLPEDATNLAVSWSSSDTSIATVSEDGVVTALSAGTVTITATVTNEQHAVSCKVTIEEAPEPYVAVTSLALDKTKLEMKTGEMQALQTTIMPENATNKTVQWSSSDEAIAIVSEAGVVKALKEGSVTITATSKDGGFVASCHITIEMSESETINIGDQIEIAGMNYSVTSLDGLSVTFCGIADETATKVIIPEKITINGKNYKVTTIAKNAFKGKKNLKSVTIGKEVTSIESQAFYNCKSLKEIIFKTKKLTNIGKKAFKGIAKKAKYSYPSAKKSLYKNLVKLSDKETVQAMSNGIYRISNVKKKTASFIKPASNKVKKISVVATVTINGKKYKVTSIANNAFKHNKKITKVIIGENVSTIGKDAFSYSEKYMYITIRSTKLKKVGKGTLKRGFKLKPPSNKKKKQYEKMFKAAYIG